MKSMLKGLLFVIAVLIEHFAISCGAIKCFAKVKTGLALAEIRGKLGGGVFTRNRGGACVRNKVSPIQPRSSSQVTLRNYWTTNAKAWRALTAAQRLSFNNAVGNFIGTDIFGDSLTPSGFNLHQQLNQNLLLAGQSVITAPPLPANVPGLATLSVTSDVSDAKITMTFTAAIDAANLLIIEATRALSAGKTYVKNEFRVIKYATNADVSPLEIQTEWAAVFGAMPQAGEKLFVRAKTIVKASGLVSSYRQASCITTA